MGLWEDWRKRLFPKGGAVLWHEVISRTAKEEISREAWADQIPEVLDTLSKSYHYKKMGIKAPWQVHLFDSPTANGFALSFPRNLGKLGFQHLFDLLKEQVQAMGYRLANSDRKHTDKGQFVQTVERHYLKPNVRQFEPPVDQRYGNVLIELVKEDDDPRYIKVMTTAYNDRQYQPAAPFHDFLERLFAPPA
ncbi:MAG TPA: hypothetical protein DCE41_18405 [Cytophagales bacterium]|nr:hypothetical protein [Cytophagales bacterium]HAA19501.1 hypothetical protein [Cytophagales bacterium]HAP59625.1 hypothetical protein [Cytophagales bacterium]